MLRVMSWLAAIFAAFVVILLILDLGLLVNLLATQGRSIDSFSGSIKATDAPILPDGQGLLPAVQRYQGTPIGDALGRLYVRAPVTRSNESWLAVLVLAGLTLSLFLSIALYLLQWSVQRAASAVTNQLRLELHAQSVRRGTVDFLSENRCGPVGLFHQQTDLVRAGVVAWWRTIPHAPLLLVLLLALAITMHPWIALAAILLASLSWTMLRWLHGQAHDREQLYADRAATQAAMLEEHLRPWRLVTGLFAADRDYQAFETALARYRTLARRKHATAIRIGPLVAFFILSGATLLLLLVGVNALREPPLITITETIVLSVALICCWYPLTRLRHLSESLPRAENAAFEIFQYLDREPGLGQLPGAKELGRIQHSLQLEEVTLVSHRTTAKLLDHASITISAGSRIAIVSSDQETPAAAAVLFARFYDPAAGRVLVDGQDIRHCSLNSLQKQTLVLLGTNQLLSGTVSENIACGNPAYSAADIVQAAKAGGAYDFIQALPQAFDTIIGEHGMRLEPEQVFLLGMTRAMLRDPSVLVIEEPQEPVGAEATQSLDEALDRVGERRTLILLPRRISTLRRADRILLIHEGTLHGDGTHAQLLQDNALYRHLNYMRFNEFGADIR
jgi:ABC-type multidrug transport system fused ATPase/permease subunit